MHLRREMPSGNPRAGPPRPGPWHPMAPPFMGGVPVDHGPRMMDARQFAAGARNFQMKVEDDDAPPSHNLWVGNVSGETSESMLGEIFSKFGEIESVTAYPQRNYAFVYFRHLDHAKAAKDSLQGILVAGSSLRIEFARAAKPSKHLWVGGISQSVSKEQLEAEFLKFGHVEEFKFMRERNCAIIDYSNLEDALSAVKYLNGRQLGDDTVRVDFLRSQPPKRESVFNGQQHAIEARDGHANDQRPFMGAPDLLKRPLDSMRSLPEPPHGVHTKVQMAQGIEGSRKQGSPSKVLWIGYPPSVKIDEQRLHNALILFGEIERIKSFPARHYAFVQFRSVDEARRAKDGLQGRLFNDPRIQILFSNSEIGPIEKHKDNSPFIPPIRGPPPQFSSMGRFVPLGPVEPSNVPGTNMALRPVGPRGFPQQHALDGRIPRPGPEPFPNFSDLSMNSPRPGNWSKLSPPTAPGLRPVRPPAGAWDGIDVGASQRESKRPRVEVTNPIGGASLDIRKLDNEGSGVMIGFRGPQPERGVSVPTGTGSTSQFMGQGGNLGSHINDNHQLVAGPGHTAPISSSMRSGTFGGQGKHYVGAEENWCWQGTIAKGGTDVCRARCVPVGKGIDSKFPDIVNCSARTDLDMLTKHFSQASDFGLVLFTPEGDQDVLPYKEFLRYLGSKHRAGVAKFSDGTTLFLVPPSDFSERVLKVPGTDRLFGVALKFLQQSTDVALQQQSQQQAALHDPPQQHVQRPLPHISQVDYSKTPLKGDSTSHAAGMPLSPPKGLATGQAAALDNASRLSTPHSASISLTPELIATLTSLLPGNFQVAGSGGTALATSSSRKHDLFHSSSGYDAPASSRQSTSGVLVEGSGTSDSGINPLAASSQVWMQHQQPLPHRSHVEQFSHQPHQHNRQFSNQMPFLSVTASSCSNSSLEQTVQGTAVIPLHQESSMKGHQVALVSQTATNELAHMPSAVAQRKDPHVGQPTVSCAQDYYRQEASLNSQKSYCQTLTTEASETVQSVVTQQLKPVSSQSSGQGHGGSGYQALSNVQSGSEEIKPELSSQAQQFEGLGTSLIGHSQGGLESEAEKNQRYQSTLQFAASLLLQIQQQQQQANKNATESTQRQQ